MWLDDGICVIGIISIFIMSSCCIAIYICLSLCAHTRGVTVQKIHGLVCFRYGGGAIGYVAMLEVFLF